MNTRKLMLAALLALIIPAAAFAGNSELRNPKLNRELASVRAAIAKYHNVAAAKDDGSIPVSPCEALSLTGQWEFTT